MISYYKGGYMKKIFILVFILLTILFFYFTNNIKYGVITEVQYEDLEILNDKFILNSEELSVDETEEFIQKEINNCRILAKNQINYSTKSKNYKYELSSSRLDYFLLKKNIDIFLVYKMNEECFRTVLN
jgi:hypothetical protein